MEISRTDHNVDASSIEPPIDLSLRLWSVSVNLEAIILRMGAQFRHLYVAGQPIAKEGRFAGRIADEHYASICNERCATPIQVSTWLDRMLDNVASEEVLTSNLRHGIVRGEIWIVLLYGKADSELPVIPSETVARVASLGLRIFLENYTAADEDGAPAKKWLPV